MNKRIAISISIVLAVGIVVTGVLYAWETGKLKDTQAEIVTLEENVSELGSNISALEIELAVALSTKVYLVNRGFIPAIITVTVGTTVTWTNLGSWLHTVSSSPPLFNSDSLEPGDSFSYTFTRQGIFSYNCWNDLCPYHGDMWGLVTVE